MNKFLTLVLFLTSIICSSQNKITFSYDTAGNQISRSLCVNCSSKNVKDTPKEIIALKEEDMQKFFPEDLISYYPNPVKEELYLKWELIQDKFVSTIQVFGLDGKALTSYSSLEKKNNQTIPFQSLPRGVYLVTLIYSNGEQKSIKIIKQ